VVALTHELKGPLAAIRGSAELLEAGGQGMPAADRAHFVAAIAAQGCRMAEMIDKLLALAAVEHRQRIEDPQSVDLLAIMQEAAEHLARKLQARSLTVQVAGGPAPARGDPFLLRQAFVNLLDNAADFAPSGSVVEVTLARDGGYWEVTVADRGAGVPDYALERAFERFYSTPRPAGGSRSSGLGLCFVAEVAALHGGRAALANRDGGGAIAGLTLPA
jgi:two-component system sensor histidine kinase CreC